MKYREIYTKKANDCIVCNGQVIGWHPFSINIPIVTEEDLIVKEFKEE